MVNETIEAVPQNPLLRSSSRPILFIVGDSTVSAFNDNYYLPRYGYGTQLHKYLKGITIFNLALPGRSSKSFISETNYHNLSKIIKAGDFLLIAFGHNDEKPDCSRYTNPNMPIDNPQSFRYFLYTYYIRLAQDRNATPILCTPIVRRNPEGQYSGAFIHITEDIALFPGGNYPEAIRSLARLKDITMIDLSFLTLKLYKSLGDEGTLKLHARISEEMYSIDNSHLNFYGAAVVAWLFAEELARTNNKLKQYLLPFRPFPLEHELLIPNLKSCSNT